VLYFSLEKNFSFVEFSFVDFVFSLEVNTTMEEYSLFADFLYVHDCKQGFKTKIKTSYEPLCKIYF
jgi:hypothetical protein